MFKSIIIVLVVLTSFNVVAEPAVQGEPAKKVESDNAGYTSDNMSAERVAMDAQWDAEQAEFDKPNP